MHDEVNEFAAKHLEGLKERLKITHDDEDDKLRKMLASSLVAIGKLVGASRYDESLVELSFERCLFIYNDALDEFKALYESEIEDLYLTNLILANEVTTDDEGEDNQAKPNTHGDDADKSDLSTNEGGE